MRASPSMLTTTHKYSVIENWNDSLAHDYLWSNGNFSEAFPDVMTPLTWSMAQRYIDNLLGMVERIPVVGNIGGRLYMNLSFGFSLAAAIGMSREKMLRNSAETFGHVPPDLDIPIVPLSWMWVLFRFFIPARIKRIQLMRALKPRIPTYVAETPDRVADFERDIQGARTPAELLALWRNTLDIHYTDALAMLAIGLSDYRTLSRKLHIAFERLVGEADATALLSGFSTSNNHLASLGLIVGLLKVKQGKMSRKAYLQQYGHRGPHEMELSIPSPKEDSEWIDQQLAQMDTIDVSAMLAEQRKQHEVAWHRLQNAVSPRKAKAYRRKLDRLTIAAKTREASRSEVVRMLGILRTFALRAGTLTGLGDGVFFLSLDELLAILNGDTAACDHIPARQETHARYAALPPYPTLIRGHFDPFTWAADPNRRSDLYDATTVVTTTVTTTEQKTIKGFAGARGIVEGYVRRIDYPEDGGQLQSGEILVATTTNVGWTPLFSRVAAVVTDVGAPFSHAAIVARELGIPAVVGCGDATMRLNTGDRVRVNGGEGIVEIVTKEGSEPI